MAAERARALVLEDRPSATRYTMRSGEIIFAYQINKTKILSKRVTYTNMWKQEEGNQVPNIVGNNHHDVDRTENNNHCTRFDTHCDDLRVWQAMSLSQSFADISLVVEESDKD